MGRISKEGYKQGIWNPIHPEKLLNKQPPVYRSKLEADYMRLLDKSDQIKKWGSENYWITYDKIEKDGTMRKARYFVDFQIINQNDEVSLIEIKPAKQIKNVQMLHENGTLPKSQKEKVSTWEYRLYMTMMDYQKWEAATKHCKERGWKFMVFTEKDLVKFQGLL